MTEEMIVALIERNEAICLGLIDGLARIASLEGYAGYADFLKAWIEEARCAWPDPVPDIPK